MSEEKELKVEDIKKLAEEKKCPVQKALFYIEGFLDGPMCGKCFPCAMGTFEARIRIKKIMQGSGTDADILALKNISMQMLESSRCKKGRDTAAFIIDWIKTGVFAEHVEGKCPDMACNLLIEYRIIPGRCNMCGLCKDVCKFNAIHGEKAKPYLGGYLPFEVRQLRCTRCGDCLKACPAGAIIITGVKSTEPVSA